MKFVNLTDGVVRLNDGREFPPSGVVARMAWELKELGVDEVSGVRVFTTTNGGVENLPDDPPDVLPEGEEDIVYIVSDLVALAAGRDDMVSPAYGHAECKLAADGRVYSVPGFVLFNDEDSGKPESGKTDSGKTVDSAAMEMLQLCEKLSPLGITVVQDGGNVKLAKLQ